MKRQLLFLLLAGGLALMAAPNASANPPGKPHPPGFCGNSYAMLMTGFEPSITPATGSGVVAGPGGFPGALTAIVGIGVIQFSHDCSSISGELIYNDGDLQFLETGVGLVGGSAACYSKEKLLVSVPCFDGGNHFTGGSVTTAGEPPGMALVQFSVNFGFFDYGLNAPTPVPFTFLIQETVGDLTLVGNTPASPTAPILTVTMQQQLTFGSLSTTFGRPPYLGNSAIVCSGQGADLDDLVANISNGNSGGVAGSWGTAVGSVNIMLNGQANGFLSFNGNDNLQVAPGVPVPPGNNTACSFSEQLDPFDGPAAFADGTSNILTSLTSPSTDPTCTNAANTDAGFTTSQVGWGLQDLNAYAITTSLTDVPDAFVPPGEMSTCTHLVAAP